MQNITITGIETRQVGTSTVYVLKSDNAKYEFFSHKRDGSPTKAYTQFQTLNLGVGKSIAAEVAEKPEQFTNAQGKEINFTRRTILYFDATQISGQQTIEAPKTAPDAVLKQIEALQDRVTLLEEQLEDHLYPKAEDDDDLKLQNIPF